MTEVKHVDVEEFEQVRRLALDQCQRDAILSCGGELSLTPEPGTDQLWSLRASCYVGTVVVPGMTVRIRPKLNISRLFVLLSAASGEIKWDEQRVGLAASATIEDVVATVLVDSISRGLRNGLLRGYNQVQEESFIARGRLELAETIRRRPLTFVPLVQTPELLDENIPENRVLATALAHLGRRVISPAVRARIVDVQRAFAEVSALPAADSLPRLVKNRLNAPWWGAVELSLLVLRSCGLDLPSGLFSARSFLVNMNVIFEHFIYRALADELARTGRCLQHNRGGFYLDETKRHALRPDLSLWLGAKCRFIGDCKYKYADDAMAHRDDIYQCLAYAAATGVPRVTLIYSGDADGARDLRIADGRTVIQVRTVDLGAPTDRLRERLRALAEEIARQA